MFVRILCLTLAVAVTSVAAAGAQGVPDVGGRVFGVFGGSFGDGGSTVMTSGGAGLRLSRHLGLDFEVLYVPNLEMSADDRFFIQAGRPFGFAPTFAADRNATVTAFLTKFTVEFPVAGDRLFPYLTGGGGVGHVSERTRYRLVDSPFPTLLEEGSGVLLGTVSLPSPLIFPPLDFESAETGLSLTVGGGLDVRVWRGLGVGVEARWLRILTNREDLDTAQVATRVSYRF